jgi:hypothetical protein
MEKTVSEIMKELLASPTNRIKLDDFVTMHIKKFLTETDPKQLSAQDNNAQTADFIGRLKKYEDITKDLQSIIILLTKWGDNDHLLLLEKIFSRLTEGVQRETAGKVLWLRLNWYPLQILMYVAGVSALAARNYAALRVILETLVKNETRGQEIPLIVLVVSNLSDINDQFKQLPGQEQKYVPRSEHLFVLLKPILEETLFLGGDYEQLFDDFEVYSALVFADLTGREWGPIGRFGWKHDRGPMESPFARLLEEAKKQKEKWPPIQGGLFRGSWDQFLKTSTMFGQLLSRITR